MVLIILFGEIMTNNLRVVVFIFPENFKRCIVNKEWC